MGKPKTKPSPAPWTNGDQVWLHKGNVALELAGDVVECLNCTGGFWVGESVMVVVKGAAPGLIHLDCATEWLTTAVEGDK